ncbi:MAG: pilus assembly protein PilM, partial [Patescibacteria group bacterium]
MRNNSIGVDISDTTIEVVELIVQGDDIKIKAAGSALLAPGIVENGRVKNPDLLASALHEVLASAHPNPISAGSIVFGLPESQMYTYVFDLGPYTEAERDDRIRKEAYTNIPLDERELTFSYSMLREDAGGARVLLVATSKEVFGEWLGFFERAGFAVTFFDVEILAAFRAIFKQHPSEPVCIVDIGAAFTVIAIFNSEGLQYIYSLKTAGNMMTAAIADAFGISEKEAEDRKISMGMLGQEGKLFSVLEKSFRPVIESIRTSLTGFHERFGQEPSEIILIGGGSKVNGLIPYVQAQFTQAVKEGKSFIQGDHVPLRYIEVVGLALRGLEREEDQKDPVMLSKNALSGAIPTVLAVHGEKRLEKKEEKMIPLEAVMATPHEIVTIRKF